MLKKLAINIGILAIGAALLLPFTAESMTWRMIIWGCSIFALLQAFILYMVALSKEETPTTPRPKRALWYYSATDFMFWFSMLMMFFLIKFGVERLDYTFMPGVLFSGVAVGLILGYFEMHFFLVEQIKEGFIQVLSEKGWLQPRVPALIAFGFVVSIFSGRETICQALFQSGLSHCFGASWLLLSGLFLGVFLAKSGWILQWERQHQQKLFI